MTLTRCSTDLSWQLRSGGVDAGIDPDNNRGTLDEEGAMAEQWRVIGDFVDFCNCSVPCPCTFAQPPTDGSCDGIIGWRVRSGNYGEVTLDGLNVAGVARFVGNIWEPETKAKGGFIIDE